VNPDCGNRATLQLTLVTGQQVTACRPHASEYPVAPAPTAHPSPSTPTPDGGGEQDVPASGAPPVSTPSKASGPARFRPAGQHDLAPSGEVERIRANLDAVRALARQLQQQRPATADEQALYARWSGWGATPTLFDERAKYAGRFAGERAELQALLGADGYRAARTTTLNAHYTDAAYVQVIWDAVTRLGFSGGTVLEPGCGSGNFLGFAPLGARLVGVELDPTTAQIAQALYPDAEIRAESFADTRLPEPGFDLVIGNVPFGSHKLHDPRHNPGREHSIHNHFIVKSLHATRPGGLVALITSRFTMDGVDVAHQHAREQMAGLADLLGAVRLPADAHQAAAGTEVVTDLLIFRRRPEGQSTATAPGWLRTRPIELPAARDSVTPDTFNVNEYFLEHPEMMLGDQMTDSGRNRPVATVRANDPDTAAALETALDRLVPVPQVVLRAAEPQLQEGLFLHDGNGRFSQIRDGRPVRHEPPKTQVAELLALIGLRETVLALLDEEATHRDDTPRMATLRAQLNTSYDAYIAKFGAVNRFQRSTGTRVDKATGEVVETERRTYPRLGGFRDDPYFPYVSALEKFDDESGEVEKAEVFTQRVIAVPVPVQRVDSADDALVVCWDRHNEVRLDVVASLLELDGPQQARQALGDLVFDEPGTSTLVRKAEYLSGNVRRKLAAAEQAAKTDPAFEVNVQALRGVVPRDLTPAEIGARLGSPWIAASYIQQFLREILEDDNITVSNLGARWSVTGGNKKGVLAATIWGTESRSATDLAENLLNSQTIEITKTVGSGKDKRTIRDIEETAFAQAKAQQIDERFRGWLWEDPDRARTLGRIYNDRFNARVPRSYEGEHVEAPGMSAAFQLHPHQMAAVARIRNSAGVGLFHGTGAGKTLEMIVGGMELVRLGLVSKPCYVVPKGVLGQFRREFLQAYPRAKVLAADTEDLTGDKRRRFVARCSTGDWDAIIISHTAFKKIPVSRAVRVDYLNKQLDRLRKHLANAKGADRYTVKDIEKQVETLDEQIKEQLAAPSDPGVEFERTGIGYLFVDEAHVYKNLRVVSSIKDLAIDGNQITADLEMKLEYLRRNGRRVVTLATATPIDNSPSEILTMTKYAAPELLTDMRIEEDDQYHAAFIQARRRVEMRPDGSGFESRVRYARYVNLTEQKQLMYSWADVKLKEHLDLGEPAIIGGKPEILAVPDSAELHHHLVTLAGRARQVKGGRPPLRLTTKGEYKKDNIRWISTDGRTASLDLRLIGDHTDAPQKIDVAADRLAEIWREHKDDIYYQADGTPEPIRGSLQLVFCDLGVPRRGRWNVYEGLRDELVARGMPADQIRFAQNAKNRRQKDQLDQDARDGKIAVLIGSRQGLGTGRNIQRRVITVLQLDPTWKLTPVTQSLGRGQRQGNDNDAIHHIFVVTENSYDPFLWQKVDDKARFTRQMLDPNDTTRVIDLQEHDDDGGTIDPAVMFAVAAGRPELLELHRTEEAVGALRLEARIWGDEQVTLKVTVEQNRRSIAGLRRDITDLDAVLARRRDTRGDAFRVTLDGTTFNSRADAGTALVRRLHTAVHADQDRQQVQLGELGGITLSAGIEAGLVGDRALLRLDGIPDSMIELTQRDLDTLAAGNSANRVGLIRSLENRLAGADDLRQRYLDSIDLLQANIDRATARIGLPFPRQADLDRYTDQLAELHQQLEILDATPKHTPGGDEGATTVASAPEHSSRTLSVATVNANTPSMQQAAGARLSADAASHAGTPSARAGNGTAPPDLWTVTVPSDDGRQTTLATAQLIQQELQASSSQPGSRIDRDGARVTVRDRDGTVAYTAAPADLPWRAWHPGEADHLELGQDLVRHLRLSPGGRFASTLRTPNDARRVLRQALAEGNPVAVTDWGVVTTHEDRPVAYLRQDVTIPDLPDVAHTNQPATSQPVPDQAAVPATTDDALHNGLPDALRDAALPQAHQQWLTDQLHRLAADGHVQAIAVANDFERADAVLAGRLEELFIDVADRADLDGIDLSARFFDSDTTFHDRFLRAATRDLYRRAKAAAAIPPTRPPAVGGPHESTSRSTVESNIEPIHVEVDGTRVHVHGVAIIDQLTRLSLAAAGFEATERDPTVWVLPAPDRAPWSAQTRILRFTGHMRQAGRRIPVTGPRTPAPSGPTWSSIRDWLGTQPGATVTALGDIDREWIEQQIRDTAADSQVRTAAWAYPQVDFATVAAGALAPRLMFAASLPTASPPLRRCADPTEPLHHDLLSYATRVMYRAIRATDPPPPHFAPGPDQVMHLPIAAANLAPGDRIVHDRNLDASPKVVTVVHVTVEAARVHVNVAGQSQRLLYQADEHVAWVNQAQDRPPHTPSAATPAPQPPGRSEPVLVETQRRRRGHAFYPPANIRRTVPALNATERQPAEDKILHLHYFGGSTDVWLAEYNPATGEGFGYVKLGNPDDAEWGSVYLPELERINHGLVIIERDLHWTAVPASQANLPGPRAPHCAPVPDAPATKPSTPPPAPLPTDSATEVEPEQTADDPADDSARIHADQAITTIVVDTTPAADTLAGPGGDLAREFTGGTPYTSRNRLRGPLARVKQSTNALLRTRGWNRTSTVGNVGALNAAITDLKGMSIDGTDPTALLAAAVRLDRQTSVLWRARHTHGVDPVFAMLNQLSRISGDFARNLVATAATPGRWQRVFGQDPPPLRPARPQPAAPAARHTADTDAPVALTSAAPGTAAADTQSTPAKHTGPDPSPLSAPLAATTEPDTLPLTFPTATTSPHVPRSHPSAAAAAENEPPTLAARPPSTGPVPAVRGGIGAAAEPSPEHRLLDKVAARVPEDVIQPPTTPGGHASVLLSFVANGTYGEVTGLGLQRQPITASGYVIEVHGLRGGHGGWHPGSIIVVKLGDLPDGPVTHTVQTEMDGRLTVLDPPRPDMPAGESAPWLRMPVEEQILAARTALGLSVEVHDGPANELWTVQGCPEQVTGEVAGWLFGGRYHSWHGRARPTFSPKRIQEAIAAGRIPAEHQPEPVFDPPPAAPDDVEARIAQLRPYTDPGPQFRRAVAEAVTYAQMKLTAGLNPTGDLLEGEVGAGQRPRADLAAWRSNGSSPTVTAPTAPEPTPGEPARPEPAMQPAWLAGVVLGAETTTADGLHQVQRRTTGRGMTVYVEARHPQIGMLPRGRLDRTSRTDSNDPAPTWQIVDYDGTPVGEHTGTYAEAEARLLAATADLDQPLSDQDAADLAADSEPEAAEDASASTDAETPAVTHAAPAADVPNTPGDAYAPEPDVHPVMQAGAAAAEPAPAAPTGESAAVTVAGPSIPSWSQRIQIVDGPSLVVAGTSGAPREEGLRGLLKQYRFRYQRASKEWHYAGRPEDRAAAIGDIRRWLATQDRADAATAAKPTAALPPTDQQQRIIDAYQAGHTIAVQALAGTGKTSTLQMLAAARPQTRVAYIAFNRSIADEAQRKFGRNVRADTSHAFAREALASTPLRSKLARVGRGARWPEEWASHLHIAVDGAQAPLPDSVARMVIATVRSFRESSADTIGREHLAGSVPEEVPGLAQAVLGYARTAWRDIADPDGRLLFDHDDYLKLWALGDPRLPYDVIFFDEAQDINDVLRQVIQDQPAQTIVVGDSNQSIYGFRGAIDALKHWPAQVTLPLTQSWRFGPAVADVGNQFLRLLNSPWMLTGNPALDTSIGSVDDPDAVLARTNAGAVAAVFDAFDDGKRVALMGGGRVIEDIAKAAIDLQAGRGTKHPELSRFANWDDVRAYVEDGDDAQSLRAFVRLVDRRGADGLLNMVKELVNEDQTGPDSNPAYDIIVSTVHKAKGREWRQVRIAEDFPQPQENLATRQTVLPNHEQLRLAYVAVTRARDRLELGSLSWINDVSEQFPLTQAAAAAVAPSRRLEQQPPRSPGSADHSGVDVQQPAYIASVAASAGGTETSWTDSSHNAAHLALLDTAPGARKVQMSPSGRTQYGGSEATPARNVHGR
jgi:N12 class adenine-specific DNA methylase/predicted RNA methylase